MTSNLQTLTAAYIEAIYFTETGDEGQPPATADLTPATLAAIYKDCANFHAATAKFGLPPTQAGHDLHLTRNGHGTGFWDRPEIYGGLTATLTAIATAMGSFDPEFETPEPRKPLVTEDQYVKDPNFCPYCASQDVTAGEVEHHGTSLTQAVTCHNCDASWRDAYTLTGWVL